MMRQASSFVIPAFGDPLYALDSSPVTQGLVSYLEAKTQAPIPLILLSILSSYSTLAHGVIDVERPGVGVGPVSLFTLGIAESGERKSAISSYLDRPIIEFQERELIRYENELQQYELDMEIYFGLRKGLNSLISRRSADDESAEDIKEKLQSLLKQQPIKPIDPKVLFEDATPESMAESLYEGLGAAALCSGEGGAILNGRITQNMPMLNKLWAGESWTVSRKTSKDFTLSNRRLSVSLLIQPKILWDFLAKRGIDSRSIGFLARFLVCYPISTQGTRFLNGQRLPVETGYSRYTERANQILDTFKTNTALAAFQRKCLTFSPEAAQFWAWVYDYIEGSMGEGGRFFNAKDHGSKLAENIARIAALLTYIERGDRDVIELDILRDATRVTFFFSDAFLMNFCTPPDYQLDDMALREFLQAKREDGIRYLRKNSIRQSGPYRVRKKVLLDAALNRLYCNGELLLLQNEAGKVFVDLWPHYPYDAQQWAIAVG